MGVYSKYRYIKEVFTYFASTMIDKVNVNNFVSGLVDVKMEEEAFRYEDKLVERIAVAYRKAKEDGRKCSEAY